MYEKFINSPHFDEGLPFAIKLAGISYCDGSYCIHREKSDILVLEYVISGCGTVKAGTRVYYPKAGDTYMLLPGESHEYSSSDNDPWVKIWFNASGSVIDALVDAYSLRGITLFRCDTSQLISKIHSLLSSPTLTIDEIAARTATVYHQIIQELSATVKPSLIKNEASMLKEYIDRNISGNVRLDELAGMISRSSAHTIRLFKESYNVTPYRYFIDSRIKKAIILLEGTRHSVKEIAYLLGFSDEHYFSGLFKSKTGKSPTEYRRSKN